MAKILGWREYILGHQLWKILKDLIYLKKKQELEKITQKKAKIEENQHWSHRAAMGKQYLEQIYSLHRALIIIIK
jgi:tRNA A22 N-methylase